MRIGGFLIAWWALSISLFSSIPWWAGFIFAIIGLIADVVSHTARRFLSKIGETPYGDEEASPFNGIRMVRLVSDIPTALSAEGKNAPPIIIYTSGLKNGMSEDEWKACMEHEAAHLKNRHAEKEWSLSIKDAFWGATTLCLIVALSSLVSENREYMALFGLLAMIYGLAWTVKSLALASFRARFHEFEADSCVNNKAALASALDKLGEEEKKFFFGSHPSREERKKRLLNSIQLSESMVG